MELDNIETSRNVHLTDAHTKPPENGKAVLALTVGGKLCETVWKADSLKYFDAWCNYPKIPKSVKRRQAGRFVLKG